MEWYRRKQRSLCLVIISMRLPICWGIYFYLSENESTLILLSYLVSRLLVWGSTTMLYTLQFSLSLVSFYLVWLGRSAEMAAEREIHIYSCHLLIFSFETSQPSLHIYLGSFNPLCNDILVQCCAWLPWHMKWSWNYTPIYCDRSALLLESLATQISNCIMKRVWPEMRDDHPLLGWSRYLTWIPSTMPLIGCLFSSSLTSHNGLRGGGMKTIIVCSFVASWKEKRRLAGSIGEIKHQDVFYLGSVDPIHQTSNASNNFHTPSTMSWASNWAQIVLKMPRRVWITPHMCRGTLGRQWGGNARRLVFRWFSQVTVAFPLLIHI